VLIVEDDEGIAELEKIRLEEAGYTTRHVFTADDALAAVRKGGIDLVLLDYRLPGEVDGLELYAKAKAEGFDVPVILVTGFGNEATVIRALRAGVRDFVTKSAEYLDYLPEAVGQVLRQVRTEHQLAQSEARLASVIGTARDAILVTNETRHVVMFNAAAEQMFGCSSKDAVTKHLFAFIPPDVGPTGKTDPRFGSVSQIIRAGTHGVRCDGAVFPLEASISRHELGGQCFHTVMVRDITDRKRAEEALHREQEFLKAVLESVQAGIVACDAEGTLTLFNQFSRDLHGRSVEPLSPDRWAEEYGLFLSDGRTPMPTERIPLFRALQGERVRDAEVTIRRPDGKRRLLLVNGQPMRNAEGGPLGAVVTAQDVTHRRRLEENLRQAQKMEAIGVLASGVAHDFNNLLTVINGFSEMLLTGEPIEVTTRGIVEEISQAGEQAAALTRQLLAFSRKQVLAPAVMDLNALVRGTERMLNRLIGADINLASSLDPGLGRVKVDAGQMETVVMNLAVNARDAMPRGGRLTIETRNVDLDAAYAATHKGVRPGDYVMIAVTDNGVGMDKETRERIFEPFFTTKEQGKGTGLGLSTVSSIVAQCGGYVDVYSELNTGTSVKVYIPRLTDGEGVVAPSVLNTSVPGGDETILLAEDDRGIRGLARVALQSYGYTVLESADGEEAIRVGLEHPEPIHLLITDVVLPKVSGREVAEKLRAACEKLRVLYTSGYTDDSIVRHGVLTADVAFLQKPYTPITLARKVREVLDLVKTTASKDGLS
jgi:PAS domain S-box-containing protein